MEVSFFFFLIGNRKMLNNLSIGGRVKLLNLRV